MNKYLLPLLLLVIADHPSCQLIYGSGKTFACAGTGSVIQTESGYSTGFFWQVSTNNGTARSTITDNGVVSAPVAGSAVLAVTDVNGERNSRRSSLCGNS